MSRWNYLLGSTLDKEFGVIAAMQERVKSLPILKRYVTLSIIIKVILFILVAAVFTLIILPMVSPQQTVMQRTMIPMIFAALFILIYGQDIFVYNASEEAILRRKELAPGLIEQLEQELQKTRHVRDEAFLKLHQYNHNPSAEDIRLIAHKYCGIVSSKLTAEQLELFWGEMGPGYTRGLAETANYYDALIQRLREEIDFLKKVE